MYLADYIHQYWSLWFEVFDAGIDLSSGKWRTRTLNRMKSWRLICIMMNLSIKRVVVWCYIVLLLMIIEMARQKNVDYIGNCTVVDLKGLSIYKHMDLNAVSLLAVYAPFWTKLVENCGYLFQLLSWECRSRSCPPHSFHLFLLLVWYIINLFSMME